MAELLGLSQVVLNRWETGARWGHSSANDARIQLVYLTLQRDEYSRRINQQIWEMLHRLFGRVRKEAAPVELREVSVSECRPTTTTQPSDSRDATRSAQESPRVYRPRASVQLWLDQDPEFRSIPDARGRGCTSR